MGCHTVSNRAISRVCSDLPFRSGAIRCYVFDTFSTSLLGHCFIQQCSYRRSNASGVGVSWSSLYWACLHFHDAHAAIRGSFTASSEADFNHGLSGCLWPSSSFLSAASLSAWLGSAWAAPAAASIATSSTSFHLISQSAPFARTTALLPSWSELSRVLTRQGRARFVVFGAGLATLWSDLTACQP